MQVPTMGIYHDFMKALKRHWKTTLPAVRPVTKACGSLPKSRSFYAGRTPNGTLHVYLHFQTHKNVGGRFTIDVILTRDEHSPFHYHRPGEQHVLGDLIDGPNRIGELLQTPYGDKWWVLCRNELMTSFGSQDRFETNPNYWQPQDWDDATRTIQDAVADGVQDT